MEARSNSRTSGQKCRLNFTLIALPRLNVPVAFCDDTIADQDTSSSVVSTATGSGDDMVLHRPLPDIILFARGLTSPGDRKVSGGMESTVEATVAASCSWLASPPPLPASTVSLDRDTESSTRPKYIPTS